jgi:hypothetical protein
VAVRQEAWQANARMYIRIAPTIAAPVCVASGLDAAPKILSEDFIPASRVLHFRVEAKRRVSKSHAVRHYTKGQYTAWLQSFYCQIQVSNKIKLSNFWGRPDRLDRIPVETLGLASGKRWGADYYMKQVQYVSFIYTVVEGES